ncbi:MAG: RNA polymerase subunit sigma-70 [Planctomycetaceae bacterium]|nr:RNA polymerase subunit sigma-70 [Planctomycetaceae bacterium]
MNGPGSVTVWLDQLKAGKTRDEAVAQLWKRYFTQLVDQARRHLRSRRAVGDGEDAALSAFDGFVRAVQAGKFPKLDDRNDLWQVLLMMTGNKAKNAIRDEDRAKRGGGMVAHGIATADSDPVGVVVASEHPDPAEAVVLAEGAERLLLALGDAELRRVAELALEGYTNAEIAATLGKAVATAERKRNRIRDIWLGLGFC